MNSTDRFALPLLEPGQAGKEITHNEALLRLEAVLHPCVEAREANSPPEAPEPGRAWLLGEDPVGEWAGQAGKLALWTAGGWRFAKVVEGMAVWNRDGGCLIRQAGGTWVSATAVPTPGGGGTVDVEARAAIAAIRSALVLHGLVQT